VLADCILCVCGRVAEPYRKYFHEPHKWGVAVLLLRNYWSLIIFKVWALLFALQVNMMWSGSSWFQRFATADAFMILLQCVLEVHRLSLCHSSFLIRSSQNLIGFLG
jgi:hypothetical protein